MGFIVARFWEDYDFHLSFHMQERYVEVYTWINSLYFEPRYARWRIILTKMLVLMSILDDTFDAYGTPQELQRFTDALKRFFFSLS